MKTKQELLAKYKSDEEIYSLIDAHYGTKASFQIPEIGIIFFDVIIVMCLIIIFFKFINILSNNIVILY